MAPKQATRAVVDASVLIAFLNREEGRYEKSRDLLLDAAEDRIELWAPMVLQVEVWRWSREVDAADSEARAKLESFLDSDWLRVVEVDRRMAKIARDIAASTSVNTGIDALYVATALIVDAPCVFTWDARLRQVRYSGVEGTEPRGATEPQLDLDSP